MLLYKIRLPLKALMNLSKYFRLLAAKVLFLVGNSSLSPVSYTHLDVYKRQKYVFLFKYSLDFIR